MLKWGLEGYGVDWRCGVVEVRGVTELLGSAELGGVAELRWSCGMEVRRCGGVESRYTV